MMMMMMMMMMMGMPVASVVLFDAHDDDDDDDFLCRKEKRPFRSVGVTRLYIYMVVMVLQSTLFEQISVPF